MTSVRIAAQNASSDPAPGVTTGTLRSGDVALAYAEAGNPDAPLVLFIHGTPGSWHAFRPYLLDPALQAASHMVAMDRPGFGESADVGVEGSLARQSKMLAPFLDMAHGHEVFLVGHSLGGTIAYRMAVDYPGRINGMVIVSSSISPELGGARWYNRLASLPLISLLVPGDLRKANEEIMPLGDELAALTPRLGEIRMPVTIIHGKKDHLVSFRNVAYAERMLSSAKIRLIADDNAGHFMLWEQHTVIAEAIRTMLRNNSHAGASITKAQEGDNR
ncbi:MAG: alpha/beta hydrolase [Pseudomonadales bacterium]|nr:alpha/beta hydrolase [Pseudomonadales bacterium]